MTTSAKTAVLEVSGVHWATSKSVAESALARRPGVVSVVANPVAQTANLVYDPERTSMDELAGWIRECGYHCAGQSLPRHLCEPPAEGHREGQTIRRTCGGPPDRRPRADPADTAGARAASWRG